MGKNLELFFPVSGCACLNQGFGFNDILQVSYMALPSGSARRTAPVTSHDHSHRNWLGAPAMRGSRSEEDFSNFSVVCVCSLSMSAFEVSVVPFCLMEETFMGDRTSIRCSSSLT